MASFEAAIIRTALAVLAPFAFADQCNYYQLLYLLSDLRLGLQAVPSPEVAVKADVW